MSNKDKATSFLKMAASGDVRSAYEKFIAKNFIHHNQYFKGDRESLMLAMEQASKISPNKSFNIKYCYEEGDTVITHSEVVKENQILIAVVHILRFEQGRVVELWDLGQEIKKDSPNTNGPF
jgi:predicted SnoaL-like aldol condensation-catalyzing enzyme